MCFDDFRELIRLYLVIHVVQQLPCSVDIIQLDARYGQEVEWLNLLLALSKLLCSLDPCRRLLRLEELRWSGVHLGHEELFDAPAVLLDSLVDGLYESVVIRNHTPSIVAQTHFSQASEEPRFLVLVRPLQVLQEIDWTSQRVEEIDNRRAEAVRPF